MAQKLRIEYVQFYTDGSSAKKLDLATPVTKATTQKLPHTEKRKKIFVDPIAMDSVFVALCLFFTIGVGIKQLKQAKVEHDAMEQYVVHLQQVHTESEEKYAAAYSLAEIEKTAIALGMVPVESVSHETIRVPAPVVEPEPTVWESVGTLLTRIFA